VVGRVVTDRGPSPAAIAGSEPIAAATTPAGRRAIERRRVTPGIVPRRLAVKKAQQPKWASPFSAASPA
jgi:hypothetical protein